MAQQPAPVMVLIDTDPAFVYLIERYGQRCGCTVFSVPTLAAARPLIETTQPALVAVHVASPAADGWQVLTALKADAATRRLPVLACGAITDAAGAVEAGADCWLSKPVMYDDFEAALAALLGGT